VLLVPTRFITKISPVKAIRFDWAALESSNLVRK
jgi:hypothetical protein